MKYYVLHTVYNATVTEVNVDSLPNNIDLLEIEGHQFLAAHVCKCNYNSYVEFVYDTDQSMLLSMVQSTQWEHW